MAVVVFAEGGFYENVKSQKEEGEKIVRKSKTSNRCCSWLSACSACFWSNGLFFSNVRHVWGVYKELPS
jgi:hypothetical protein